MNIDDLKTIYIKLTESGTKNVIRLRADQICGIVENTRGTVDIWTNLTSDGSAKVFTVDEEGDSIISGMREAFLTGGKK